MQRRKCLESRQLAENHIWAATTTQCGCLSRLNVLSFFLNCGLTEIVNGYSIKG